MMKMFAVCCLCCYIALPCNENIQLLKLSFKETDGRIMEILKADS